MALYSGVGLFWRVIINLHGLKLVLRYTLYIAFAFYITFRGLSSIAGTKMIPFASS